MTKVEINEENKVLTYDGLEFEIVEEWGNIIIGQIIEESVKDINEYDGISPDNLMILHIKDDPNNGSFEGIPLKPYPYSAKDKVLIFNQEVLDDVISTFIQLDIRRWKESNVPFSSHKCEYENVFELDGYGHLLKDIKIHVTTNDDTDTFDAKHTFSDEGIFDKQEKINKTINDIFERYEDSKSTITSIEIETNVLGKCVMDLNCKVDAKFDDDEIKKRLVKDYFINLL